jgi:uncharacterized protein (TIGR02246 family)
VAAVVLLESGHHEQFKRLPAAVGQVLRAAVPMFQGLAREADSGRLTPEQVDGAARLAQWPELQAVYRRQMLEPRSYRTRAAEIASSELSAGESGAAGLLGDIPVVIMTAANSFNGYASLGIPIDSANRVWAALQAEFLGLSRNTQQLISYEGTHDLALEAPDFVASGVVRAVRRARSGAPGNARRIPDAGAALDRMWQRYVPAIVAEDLAIVRTFFTDDAVLMPPNQAVVRGAGGAVEWFRELFAGYRIALDMPTDELRISGETAYRVGRYHVTLTPEGGGPSAQDHGKFVQIYERQEEGEWRIARGILNSAIPPARQ